MGQNLFRVTIGTSDFTGQPWYSYDDGQPDPNMDRFSIQKDIDDGIIDVLKDMLAINPNVKFFGSVWSPPGWMKDTGVMNGGNLVSANIPALAKYFRKFVEATGYVTYSERPPSPSMYPDAETVSVTVNPFLVTLPALAPPRRRSS